MMKQILVTMGLMVLAHRAAAQHVVGTATIVETSAVLSFRTVPSPTDSIDRTDHDLKLYPIPNADELADAYVADGKKWFYPPHTPDRFYPLLDSNLIPITEYSFGRHRNPVMISQAALAFFSAYVETGSPEHRRGFTNNVDWLLENHDDYYFRYDFDWTHGGNVLDRGWVSAMAQGEALAAVTSAYHLTGEQKYLDTASGIFRTMYKADSTWVFYVDSDGYYWLEEYPNPDLCHVLNGILFGLWGLWDYYVVAGDPFALELFSAGLAAVADNYEMWNIRGADHSRYCLHGLKYDYYHETHLRQFDAYLQHFDIPEFEAAADVFTRYRSLALSADSLDFGLVSPGESVSRTVLLVSNGTDAIDVESSYTTVPEFDVVATSTTIQPRDTLALPVTFTGERTGRHTGVLRIRTSAGLSEVVLTAEVMSGVASEAQRGLPSAFGLGQNYPNPFSGTTEISFHLPHRAHVHIALYNVRGQVIDVLVDRDAPAGEHSVEVPVPSSGVYFYRMHADGFSRTRPLVSLGNGR